jgi:hypothetical protein
MFKKNKALSANILECYRKERELEVRGLGTRDWGLGKQRSAVSFQLLTLDSPGAWDLEAGTRDPGLGMRQTWLLVTRHRL